MVLSCCPQEWELELAEQQNYRCFSGQRLEIGELLPKLPLANLGQKESSRFKSLLKECWFQSGGFSDESSKLHLHFEQVSGCWDGDRPSHLLLEPQLGGVTGPLEAERANTARNPWAMAPTVISNCQHHQFNSLIICPTSSNILYSTSYGLHKCCQEGLAAFAWIKHGMDVELGALWLDVKKVTEQNETIDDDWRDGCLIIDQEWWVGSLIKESMDDLIIEHRIHGVHGCSCQTQWNSWILHVGTSILQWGFP